MPRKNVYVGNLPSGATETDIRKMFSRHGAVHSAKVIMDRETGRSRGFGFVEMDGSDADKAISALNGDDFKGRKMTVTEARPQGQNHGARGGQGAPAVTRGGNPGQRAGGNPTPNPAQHANAGAGGAQDNKFHNPYHFVPTEKPDESRCLTKEDFLKEACSRHSHAVYHELSGRLVCKLTTVEPVFIGAHEQPKSATDQPETPKKLANFELDSEPAIPATSLRGLLSSIAEAASGSALRILEDRTLSYRKPMTDSLSALGMIVKEGDKLKLLPLSMPTLERENNGWRFPNRAKYGEYTKMFPPLAKTGSVNNSVLPMKVYVGNYDYPKDSKTQFILNNKSFKHEEGEYFYLKLNKHWNYQNGWLLTDNASLHIKNNNYVTAQNSLGNLAPITEKEFAALKAKNDPSCDEYTRGILRILGKDPTDRSDIPGNKKHELFIPYPEGVEKAKPYPIESAATDRYNDLAAERAEATEKEEKKSYARHPYLPKGTREDKDKRFWELKDGDIVYFRPDNTGSEVAEISFSSIWRGSVGSNVHDFFKKIDPDILPFNERRTLITPAELLFGFVQGGKKKEGSEEEDRLAFAGKVMVSFGITTSEKFYYQNGEGFGPDGCIPLKILGSPKPPCPAMYFKKKNGSNTYISKSGLNLANDAPQGRKMYLHKKEGDNGDVAGKSGPWETKDRKENYTQKVIVRPIRTGVTFYFHIDFNNLNNWELGLLCYAVKPCDTFHHKIGMGKPLGLGTVKIEPVGLFMVDREKRYKETDLFDKAKRYHNVDIVKQDEMEKLPDIYCCEKKCDTKTPSGLFDSYQTEYSEYMSGKYPHAKKALELLGDRDKVIHKVHTPLKNGQGSEDATFSWFVENDRRNRKMLTPITEKTTNLPDLERN